MKNHGTLSNTKRIGPVWALVACFICLLFSNCAFSYFELSTLWAMEIGLFLFVVPSAVLIGWNFRSRPAAVDDPPPWVWALLLGLSALPRLWKIGTLSSWPVADEGMYGYFATLLERKWDWDLVHTPFNISSPYSWLLFIFFKLFHNSLTTLWLPPALLGWGYLWFFRRLPQKWVSPTLSFYTTCWMAFGFWPLYLGRFSHQAIFFLFWECGVLTVLFKCLDLSNEDPASKGWWRGLAIMTGLGFYTYLAWPMVAFMVFLAFLSRPIQPLGRKLQDLFWFGSWTLFPAIPLFLSFARNNHHYLEHLWAFGTPENPWVRLQLPLLYLKNIFWGSRTPGAFCYGPLWGGLLNPIQTTLVLLGLFDLLRAPFQPRKLWILAAFPVFFAPAFLTNSLEMMRLVGLIPFLAYLSALGVVRLLASLSSAMSFWVFPLILIASFILDAHHLFQVYPDIQKQFPGYYGMHKSLEYEKAFHLLEQRFQKNGPGLLLLNDDPDPYDRTLYVTTYAFNAAENPDLHAQDASWAGILVNIHEEPYLSRTFPGAQWTWLSNGLHRQDGGWLLAVVPIDPSSREKIENWTKGDQALQELTHRVMELGVDPDQNGMLKLLDKVYPFFKGDRMMESRYWRLWSIHQIAGGNLKESIEGEKRAIELGYPMAHLYNELGCLYYKANRLEEARKAFKKALGSKLNCTNAAENLQNLDFQKANR